MRLVNLPTKGLHVKCRLLSTVAEYSCIRGVGVGVGECGKGRARVPVTCSNGRGPAAGTLVGWIYYANLLRVC